MNPPIFCEHPCCRPELGHQHQMHGLSAVEQTELNQILLYDEAQERGDQVTAYCPNCPTGHFHTERYSEAGITYGGWEESNPDNTPSWGWRLHQWEAAQT